MKRRSGFATVIVAALITFGSLFAIAGPRHFNQHRHHHHWQHCEDEKTGDEDLNNQPKENK